MSTDTEAKHEFQAEVRQLLDIVINSLYTDKEIFVRELVSNASDALEKLRHLQLTEKEVFDDKLELEINITTDETAKTITIADHGIGLTRDEMVENLGTIAHSGSKAFIESLKNDSDKAGTNVIGKFGVGFYSAFMVAKRVKVYAHSWQGDAEHLCWTSDGQTGYEIEVADGQRRGCKIVIELQDDCEEFAKSERIKGVLEKYSNFVSFPIHLNGDRINNVEALWLKSKSEITDEEYNEFYKFTANAFDDPQMRMHFSADAPLMINSLVFVPKENQERFGFGQMDPGVALYCRKVLIDEAPKELLPEWLRFLRGVIDSEDIPLNISRESMQDSALVRKLGSVITKRFLKFLHKEAQGDAAKYNAFFADFGRFIKEGIASDVENKEPLGKLVRFESSMTEKGELTGLGDYLTRAKDGQEQIYYQNAPSREAIEAGPYLEAFKARGLEVLYLYEALDDYVATTLGEFDGKKLVSVDSKDVKLDGIDSSEEPEGEALDEDAAKSLCGWMKDSIGDQVEEIRLSDRLIGSPAMAINRDEAMTPQMRQMMKAMNQDVGGVKVDIELNAHHPLIKNLATARETKPELAEMITAQIFDNALLGAGLLEEEKGMIQRVYDIMGAALEDQDS